MPRLRICHIITELRPSGAERAMYELCVRLDPSRFEVHVVGLRGGSIADRLVQAGVPVLNLDVRSRLEWGKLRQLAAYLRQHRFDLVHTHLFHADLVGRWAARRAGVPRFIHTEQVAEMRFRPWQFAWARLTDRWCDRIVCCSKAVAEHHARKTHLPASRYTVIYNGVDAPAFAPDPLRRAALRQEWGVKQGDVLAAWVARLDPQKNTELFLAALERLRAGHPEMKVVMAGDGPQRPMVERFIRRHVGGGSAEAPWIRLLGYTEDVAGLLWASDMLVLPSRWEGFGIAAAEAMAAERPVIGTRVPGLTEVIADGVTGLLIESGDLPALTGAMERLLADAALRAKLGAAGKSRVQNRFSIEANVAAHQNLYAEVCSAATR